MNKRNFSFTSESVTEGHPDKVCDQISDAVLDDVIRQDPGGRVACETFITIGLVVVGGEITTKGWVDLQKLVRNVLTNIGYTNTKYGFDARTCAILNAIGRQSEDIAQGVNAGGAGDQGSMIGYACSETPELMPLPIMLAHKLTRKLAEVRKKGIINYLGPDGKSQVTVEYQNGKPVVVDRAVIAAQHTEEVVDKTGKKMNEEARKEITEKVIIPTLGEFYDPRKTKLFINETGKFVIGGPQSDTGMTGRKIIVDTYGGMAAHGGGAFSGKDPTKVDRSGSYMARYIAKNIVASELADKCMVQLAYVIGVAEPVCVDVNTFGTGKVPEERLMELVKKRFQLTPQGMIKMLNLLRPIYEKTAAYGHFGREEEEFTWERKDKAKDLKKEA
ncbi:MAG: methionine adenosyltransferase [Elusimicrobiota bacterium]|nr:methionine adenosyltransferase [Elusimicrobiota bacterium]